MTEPYELRFDDRGDLDEVCASNATVHLERLSKKRWYLDVIVGDKCLQVWFGGKQPTYHEISDASEKEMASD